MRLFNSFSGSMRIRITSASVESTLFAINEHGVTLNDISYVNDLVIELSIARTQFAVLKDIVIHYGGDVQILKKEGVYWSIKSLKRRPVFLLGLLLYAFLAIYLPTRVLFVQVEGASKVALEIILDQAQYAGIRFGASRSAVRSERVKNALMASVPELRWVGVNTYGCVAVISVQERNDIPKIQDSSGISSIVAKCDGIIDELVITRGNALCKVGQAVVKDQMLVSGYTDCGISIKAISADAEVYAKTLHELQLVMPLEYNKRTQLQWSTKKFSVFFGKKLIKLYNDSGISSEECVKMYNKSYLMLPGGFTLPAGIVTETLIFYDTEDTIAQEETLFSLVSDLGAAYLKDNMVCGEIISSTHTAQTEGMVYTLNGRYFCREMIGKVFNEEIITADE